MNIKIIDVIPWWRYINDGEAYYYYDESSKRWWLIFGNKYEEFGFSRYECFKKMSRLKLFKKKYKNWDDVKSLKNLTKVLTATYRWL
jgi:hypothetical protein